MNIPWMPLQAENPTVWQASSGTMTSSIYAQDGGFTLFFNNGRGGHSGKGGHHSANLGNFPTLDAAKARAQTSFDTN